METDIKKLYFKKPDVSGCTGHFLTEAVNALVYKTPQKIIDYIDKHKHDYLIKNPLYNGNKNL